MIIFTKLSKEILAIANIARAKTKIFDKKSIVENWINS
jgi:guanylate kinase